MGSSNLSQGFFTPHYFREILRKLQSDFKKLGKLIAGKKKTVRRATTTATRGDKVMILKTAITALKRKKQIIVIPLRLKLVSAIFYQILFFLPNDSPSKTMKNVFHFI